MPLPKKHATSNYNSVNPPPTFNTYIGKVLKQVHPDSSMNSSVRSVVNNILMDVLKKVMKEAVEVSKMNGTKTVNPRDIQSALRLEIPGQLNKHAVSEGTKAVTKFSAAER